MPAPTFNMDKLHIENKTEVYYIYPACDFIRRYAMPAKNNGEKRKMGRPVEKPMAEPIDDTPENVARALLFSKPREPGEWKYMKVASGGE